MRKPARLPLEELEPYLLSPPARVDPSTPPQTLDWRVVFGNDNPVEIEVGFGKGLFLLNAAQARPDVNFAGIEIERKYQLFTATRIAKRELRNVRLACADARTFLRDHVVSGSIQAVHVYFPDPWWKKRHHKRRVFTEDFAKQCARVLRPGGKLYVATDVEEYFHIINEVVGAVSILVAASLSAAHEPQHDMDYLTNFERKAVKEGSAVFRAVFEKSSEPPA